MSPDEARSAVFRALDLQPEVWWYIVTAPPTTPWRAQLWRSADGLRVQILALAVRWGHA